ncbi:hypothetical protein CPB85DRAFT_1301868 [Mucidula mucida]|nr:hypothetical protein CPB85DRAFT_1301868 [Mucidula mucida]
MLFLFSVVALLALSVMMAFRYRVSLAPYVPERVKMLFPALSHYTPLRTFADQASAGLSSNMRSGDSRAGLDEQGTQEVLEIMRRERVNFDQARLIRHNKILAQNGIDSSGMPLDSKAITRL